MNKLFATREVQKTYLALVTRKPASLSGELTHYLVKNGQNNTVKAYQKSVANSQKAVLEYHFIQKYGNDYLLQVLPHTGRPHQIRVQLSTMGCPIKGDLKYGAPQANPDASINLHARQLDFIHPIKQEPVKIIAGLPGNNCWPSDIQVIPRRDFVPKALIFTPLLKRPKANIYS